MGYYGYAPYVSVAQKRINAQKTILALKKKNPNISPVELQGNAIATTWWGKAWNSNLESYSDLANRIGRGRSYVRHGAVLHLEITSGKINALVQGSRKTPYNITITINPLVKNKWEGILSACEGKLDSLQELLEGKFPKGLKELFTNHESGLFPSPDEIEFDCSCPDYAYMCKHIAAVLYGIGARLDLDPSLFFLLREVSIDELIEKAIQNKTEKLLKKSSSKSRRIIDTNEDISDLFGIDINEPEAIPVTQEKRKRGRPKKQI